MTKKRAASPVPTSMRLAPASIRAVDLVAKKAGVSRSWLVNQILTMLLAAGGKTMEIGGVSILVKTVIK
jgi:hypothetical protein